MSLGGNLGGSLDPDTLKQYVGEVNFPAKKDELAEKAEQNGAPQQVVDQIKGADKDEFSNLDDVQSTLGNVL
ncbi:MAG: DUF2795 domain-containing protein [Rubrobacter sp.]|nr:DUF2795 domain-containing protein [Rubrobacter sp.]